MDSGNEKFLARKRSFTFGAYGGIDKFISANESSQPEATENHILDILDSPSNETKPFTSTNPNQKVTELFAIIEKLQGSRLEEQRCEFPPPFKSRLRKVKGGLPLILSPKSGGYWIDPQLEWNMDKSPTGLPPPFGLESYDLMERDSEAKIYREFFRHRYHLSFSAIDPSMGPLVMSVCLEEEENRLRVILRTNECSLHGTFCVSLFHHFPTAVELAKMLCASVSVSSFEVVSYLKAPELIIAFDEHRVSQNFKFGVLYQKEGQLTEEDILSNNDESEEFKDFLSILGQTVTLRGFTGFRGGLDVSYGQTGSEAIFTSFHGREIMFHVATKLPFTDGDTQQLQRKRHIGNDIVAVVYQEGQVPFFCDVISSHFLHCFIAVRRVKRENRADGANGAETRDKGAFQVSVTAREDVPPFGPPLPSPPIFTEGSVLREFLLTKLINAEISCYKAERFSKLELRTRSSLLEALRSELSTRSQSMLGEPTCVAPPPGEGGRATPEGGGGFIENFKRAIRVRSHSFDTLGAAKKTGITGAQKQKDGDCEPGHRSPGTGLDNTEVKGQTSPQEDI